MRRPIGPLIVAALLAAGCGAERELEAGGADPAAVEVIDAWAETLSAGDIDGAASYFAIPSVASNGPLFEIEDAGDARLFNASLPCGAELIATRPSGDFVIATFRLTERPGPGTCGSGVGQRASTAFAIDDGKIVQWRRVPTEGGTGPPSAPSTSA
jgi:hypothetical protein